MKSVVGFKKTGSLLETKLVSPVLCPLHFKHPNAKIILLINGEERMGSIF